MQGEIPDDGRADGNPSCPWLPAFIGFHDFSITRRHGADKRADFYLDALRYAQSLWISGKPAQAILQINKSLMADLSEDAAVLLAHPPPYQAMVWIIGTASSGHFGYLGNPVRHFQHLASRMSGPQAELRAWRAWLCFHLAEKTLDRALFPRDGEQITREGLWIPGLHRTLGELEKSGWPGEARLAIDTLLL